MASTRKLAAFRLEPEILDGMEQLRAREGIPASEQVRRALRAYLADKGVRLPRPAAPRPGGKKR